MLSKRIARCCLPVVKGTIFSSPAPMMPPVRALPTVLPSMREMPTMLLDAEKLQQLNCGTGQPAQRGRRKPLVWKRRKPWFDHQWSLDLKRVKKGPETPHFPDGVPFTQVRAFQSFAGRSWKINAGRRRKIRLSLKRGRRKLL